MSSSTSETTGDTSSHGRSSLPVTAATTALGYVAPWTRPVGVVVARRAKAKAAARAAAPVVRIPRREKRGLRSRLASRTTVVVVGVAVAGAVAAGLELRGGRRTPPPVAPHPPRVEDVPTGTDDRSSGAE